MLMDKTIQVFDQERLKRSYFITYTYFHHEEENHVNGIIESVNENRITVLLPGPSHDEIPLESVIAGTHIIRGVLKDAL